VIAPCGGIEISPAWHAVERMGACNAAEWAVAALILAPAPAHAVDTIKPRPWWSRRRADLRPRPRRTPVADIC
jgi:hypothetical protein